MVYSIIVFLSLNSVLTGHHMVHFPHMWAIFMNIYRYEFPVFYI